MYGTLAEPHEQKACNTTPSLNMHEAGRLVPVCHTYRLTRWMFGPLCHTKGLIKVRVTVQLYSMSSVLSERVRDSTPLLVQNLGSSHRCDPFLMGRCQTVPCTARELSVAEFEKLTLIWLVGWRGGPFWRDQLDTHEWSFVTVCGLNSNALSGVTQFASVGVHPPAGLLIRAFSNTI